MSAAQDAIIGCICQLADKVMPECVRAGAVPAWFEGESHAAYKAAVELYAHGKPLDVLTMQAAEGVGEAYLHRCIDAAPIPAHVAHYLETASAEYKLRMAKLTARANQQAVDTATIQDIEQTLADIRGGWVDISRVQDKEQEAHEVADELIAEWMASQDDRTLRPEWPLDEMNLTLGEPTDEIIYLIGDESAGKTAFVLQMMARNANRGLISSLASLESSKRRLLPRLIGHIGQVNTLKLKLRRGDGREYAKASEAAITLQKWEKYLRITDKPMTVETMAAWGQCEKAAGSKLLILDNMKHIGASQRYGNVVEQFRDLSSKIKYLRDDTGLPVIMLHHTNAEGDVSWSRDIKRDADTLIFLGAEDGSDMVTAQIRKNRDGVRNIEFCAHFKKNVQTFEELKRA